MAANRTESCVHPLGALAVNFVAGEVPAEIQLLPSGRVEGRDGRYWYNTKPEDIIAAFDAHDGPLVIDYEHATEFNWDNQPVPAAGWITALEIRNGEVWAKVEWTEKAEAMIAAKEYRFISPVFYYLPETFLIIEMVSAGLTNQPNLKLTALNNARGKPSADQPTETSAMNKEQYIALCRALGLKDDADIASVMAAISANKKAATPDVDAFVPRADFDAMKERADNAEKTIKDEAAKAANAEIEALVDGAIAAGKIEPSSKDYHIAACQQDGGVDKFKAMIGTADVNPLASNSQLDDTNPAAKPGALTDEEKAVCKMAGTSEADFIKARDGE